VLRTLLDQAIYGRARLSAGSLAIWAEGESHDGRGAEPILLEAVSCSASGRGFESVVRYIAIPTYCGSTVFLSADSLTRERRPLCGDCAI
jgi:hypothetical protein